MDIMERIASALEKVEAIKASETTVYEHLRKDLATDLEKLLRSKPITTHLDAKSTANYLLPSLLGGLPEAEKFGKELDIHASVAAGKIHTASESLQKTNGKNTQYAIFLSGVLSIIALVFGLLTWHYQGYKAVAYKYNYLSKMVALGENKRTTLSSSLAHMDSMQVNDFTDIENFVDTTDVVYLLALAHRKIQDPMPEKSFIQANQWSELHVPFMFKIILLLIIIAVAVIIRSL